MTLIALQDDDLNVAGALVWWSLKGDVGFEDLREAAEIHEIPADWLPVLPKIETVAQRAGHSQISGKRQLLRPLRTAGSYEFVEEVVVGDGANEKLQHAARVRVRVIADEKGGKTIDVAPTADADIALAQAIAAAVELYRDALTPSDLSVWLVWLLDTKVQAVSLRDRGGFYFVPAGAPLALWRKIVKAVHAASTSRCSLIPALRSEDAVDAVLHAVRQEASEAFAEMEQYLEGDVSTRGLNAHERRVQALQTKLTTYAGVLSQSLPDLESRAEKLAGAIVAARALRATL